MTSERTSTEACMMPWCEVPVLGAAKVLFGFALQHPRTGGMAWTRSSPIVDLSSDGQTARTASGTQWTLGLRVSVLALHDLGLEARMAFALLFESDGLDAWMTRVPETGLDRQASEKWLTACKMSRHLVVAAPEPNIGAIDAFLLRHGRDYVERRRYK